MKEEQENPVGLPENAFRPLKPGEKYEPLMSPDKTYPEVNLWSVSWGIVMAVIFSAAAAYLGLKVGQVFEAAIPIAIIAVGVSSATKRCHLYASCSLYPAGKVSRNDGQLYADVHQLPAGRCAGYSFPDSIP